MKQSTEQLAAHIDLIVFDVDGVLTRGEISYAGAESETKVFDVQDGLGFVLARRAGLMTALITGRSSEAVRRRARELQVDALLEGQSRKGAALAELMAKLRVKPSRVCYVGDDLPDLPALGLVGLPVAVANAVPEVREAARAQTERRGGEGAAREIIEYILKAKGLWKSIVQSYQGEEP
jgi:3-deoxy-D-manno-octulosonate 8-phosphate phosphatase (KDO 8-P phosphatase)